MDWSPVCDFTSLFPIQGSGDSEVEYGNDFFMAVDDSCGRLEDDDDYAESCNGDGCESISVDECSNGEEDDDDQDYGYDYNIYCYQGCWSCEKMVLANFASGYVCSNTKKEPGGFIDGNRMIHEVDDKQFWEACLTLGYP